MKIAIYARVSTTDQTPDMQLMHLREYVQAKKSEIYKEYVDLGISGTKDSRPALNQLMDDARKRKFDAVLVYRFDRFARSSKHLITALEDFKSLNIDFISYQENIDTSSPLGKAIFTIVGAIAELERNIIVERVKSGLKSAKSKGKLLGRPKVSINISEAKQLKDNGFSLRSIASQLKTSKTTISKYLNLN